MQIGKKDIEFFFHEYDEKKIKKKKHRFEKRLFHAFYFGMG
jgi:hypothetical protein